MEILLLFAVCLQYLCPVQGSSDVRHVFVLKGEDVRLEVQKDVKLKEETDDFIWKSNRGTKILRYNLQSKIPLVVYKNNVEFSEGNYSLLLKNLQEGDSGLYHAVVSGEEEDVVANYNVTVQERVSPAVLTVTSVSSSNLTESCNLTVTCRGQDSSVNSTFRCHNQTCSQEGGERSEVMTSTVPLYVYLLNGSIICNHSNQVSWSKNMTEIQPLCQLHPGSTPIPIYIIIIAGVVGLLVVIGVVLGLHYWKKRKDDKEENGNTVYAFPESMTRRAPEMTTYSFVGPHSAPIPAQPEQNTLIMTPGSEDAQVQKHGT